MDGATHVADELGPVDDLNGPRNKILARWKVHDGVVDGCAVAVFPAAVAIKHGGPDGGRVVRHAIADGAIGLDISKDLSHAEAHKVSERGLEVPTQGREMGRGLELGTL